MFEIMALVKKKTPKFSEKLRKKSYVQLVKKFLKLDEKTKTKTEGSQLMKNLLN